MTKQPFTKEFIPKTFKARGFVGDFMGI